MEESLPNEGAVGEKCPICDKTFSSDDKLRFHVREVHAREPTYKCQFCDAIYLSTKNLALHVQGVHQTPTWDCRQCPKKYNSAANLERHVQTSHSNAGEGERNNQAQQQPTKRRKVEQETVSPVPRGPPPSPPWRAGEVRYPQERYHFGDMPPLTWGPLLIMDEKTEEIKPYEIPRTMISHRQILPATGGQAAACATTSLSITTIPNQPMMLMPLPVGGGNSLSSASSSPEGVDNDKTEEEVSFSDASPEMPSREEEPLQNGASKEGALDTPALVSSLPVKNLSPTKSPSPKGGKRYRYRCDRENCGIYLTSKSGLKKHLNFHEDPTFHVRKRGSITEDRDFVCTLCDNGFAVKSVLIYHIIGRHTGVTNPETLEVKCPFCNFLGNAEEPRNGLYKHVSRHLDNPGEPILEEDQDSSVFEAEEKGDDPGELVQEEDEDSLSAFEAEESNDDRPGELAEEDGKTVQTEEVELVNENQDAVQPLQVDEQAQSEEKIQLVNDDVKGDDELLDEAVDKIGELTLAEDSNLQAEEQTQSEDKDKIQMMEEASSNDLTEEESRDCEQSIDGTSSSSSAENDSDLQVKSPSSNRTESDIGFRQGFAILEDLSLPANETLETDESDTANSSLIVDEDDEEKLEESKEMDVVEENVPVDAHPSGENDAVEMEEENNESQQEGSENKEKPETKDDNNSPFTMDEILEKLTAAESAPEVAAPPGPTKAECTSSEMEKTVKRMEDNHVVPLDPEEEKEEEEEAKEEVTGLFYPYRCSKCGYYFKTESNLSNHFQIHTRYDDPDEEALRIANNAKRNVKVCPLCSRGYNDQGALTKHIISTHSGITDPNSHAVMCPFALCNYEGDALKPQKGLYEHVSEHLSQTSRQEAADYESEEKSDTPGEPVEEEDHDHVQTAELVSENQDSNLSIQSAMEEQTPSEVVTGDDKTDDESMSPASLVGTVNNESELSLVEENSNLPPTPSGEDGEVTSPEEQSSTSPELSESSQSSTVQVLNDPNSPVGTEEVEKEKEGKDKTGELVSQEEEENEEREEAVVVVNEIENLVQHQEMIQPEEEIQTVNVVHEGNDDKLPKVVTVDETVDNDGELTLKDSNLTKPSSLPPKPEKMRLSDNLLVEESLSLSTSSDHIESNIVHHVEEPKPPLEKHDVEHADIFSSSSLSPESVENDVDDVEEEDEEEEDKLVEQEEMDEELVDVVIYTVQQDKVQESSAEKDETNNVRVEECNSKLEEYNKLSGGPASLEDSNNGTSYSSPPPSLELTENEQQLAEASPLDQRPSTSAVPDESSLSSNSDSGSCPKPDPVLPENPLVDNVIGQMDQENDVEEQRAPPLLQPEREKLYPCHCEKCGFYFKMQVNLRRHIRFHYQKERISVSQEQLSKYKRDPEKICSFCNRDFQTKELLVNHIIGWHTGIMDPYSPAVQCAFCSFQGNAEEDSNGLLEHIQEHLSQSFSSPESEGKNEENQGDLSETAGTDTGEVEMVKEDSAVEDGVTSREVKPQTSDQCIENITIQLAASAAVVVEAAEKQQQLSSYDLLQESQATSSSLHSGSSPASRNPILAPASSKPAPRKRYIPRIRISAAQKICQLCSLKCQNKPSLINHMIYTHTEIKSSYVKCPLCDYSGISSQPKRGLYHHLAEHLQNEYRAQQVEEGNANTAGETGGAEGEENHRADDADGENQLATNNTTLVESQESISHDKEDDDLPQDPEPSCSKGENSSPPPLPYQAKSSRAALGKRVSKKRESLTNAAPSTCPICSIEYTTKESVVFHLIFRHTGKIDPDFPYVKCPLCSHQGNKNESKRALYKHVYEHISKLEEERTSLSDAEQEEEKSDNVEQDNVVESETKDDESLDNDAATTGIKLSEDPGVKPSEDPGVKTSDDPGIKMSEETQQLPCDVSRDPEASSSLQSNSRITETHICQLCFQKLKAKEDLIIHLIYQHTKVIYPNIKCPFCDYQGTVKEPKRGLYEHVQLHLNSSQEVGLSLSDVTGGENQEVDNANGTEDDVEAVVKTSDYIPPKGGKDDTSKETADDPHLDGNEVPGNESPPIYYPFSCEVCGLYFRVRTGLTKHLSAHKKFEEEESLGLQPKLRCLICPKGFQSKSALTQHTYRWHMAVTDPTSHALKCPFPNCDFVGHALKTSEKVLYAHAAGHLKEALGQADSTPNVSLAEEGAEETANEPEDMETEEVNPVVETSDQQNEEEKSLDEEIQGVISVDDETQDVEADDDVIDNASAAPGLDKMTENEYRSSSGSASSNETSFSSPPQLSLITENEVQLPLASPSDQLPIPPPVLDKQISSSCVSALVESQPPENDGEDVDLQDNDVTLEESESFGALPTSSKKGKSKTLSPKKQGTKEISRCHCERCGIYYRNPVHLGNHLKWHDYTEGKTERDLPEDKTTACNICFTNFATKPSLELHIIRRHTGIRDPNSPAILCPFCKFVGNAEDGSHEFRVHVRTHVNQPYEQRKSLTNVADDAGQAASTSNVGEEEEDVEEEDKERELASKEEEIEIDEEGVASVNKKEEDSGVNTQLEDETNELRVEDKASSASQVNKMTDEEDSNLSSSLEDSNETSSSPSFSEISESEEDLVEEPPPDQSSTPDEPIPTSSSLAPRCPENDGEDQDFSANDVTLEESEPAKATKSGSRYPDHCEPCGNYFRNATHLRKHLKGHSNTVRLQISEEDLPSDRSKVCSVCLRNYATKYSLAFHLIRWHTGIKDPNSPDVPCPFVRCNFVGNADEKLMGLQVHVLEHLNLSFEQRKSLLNVDDEGQAAPTPGVTAEEEGVEEGDVVSETSVQNEEVESREKTPLENEMNEERIEENDNDEVSTAAELDNMTEEDNNVSSGHANSADSNGTKLGSSPASPEMTENEEHLVEAPKQLSTFVEPQSPENEDEDVAEKDMNLEESEPVTATKSGSRYPGIVSVVTPEEPIPSSSNFGQPQSTENNSEEVDSRDNDNSLGESELPTATTVKKLKQPPTRKRSKSPKKSNASEGGLLYPCHCKPCGYYFRNKFHLKKHEGWHFYTEPLPPSQRNLPEDKTTICNFCFRKISCKPSLVLHMIRWHTGITDPYSHAILCPFCKFVGNADKGYNKFIAHVRSHVNQPYEQRTSLEQNETENEEVGAGRETSYQQEEEEQESKEETSLEDETQVDGVDQEDSIGDLPPPGIVSAMTPEEPIPSSSYFGQPQSPENNSEEVDSRDNDNSLGESELPTATTVKKLKQPPTRKRSKSPKKSNASEGGLLYPEHCKPCGFYFRNAIHLGMHVKSHAKTVPLPVSEQDHSKDRNKMCSFCFRGFANKEKLTIHIIQYHTGVKNPYSHAVQCAFCSFMGNAEDPRSKGLLYHMRKHVGQPFDQRRISLSNIEDIVENSIEQNPASPNANVEEHDVEEEVKSGELGTKQEEIETKENETDQQEEEEDSSDEWPLVNESRLPEDAPGKKRKLESEEPDSLLEDKSDKRRKLENIDCKSPVPSATNPVVMLEKMPLPDLLQRCNQSSSPESPSQPTSLQNEAQEKQRTPETEVSSENSLEKDKSPDKKENQNKDDELSMGDAADVDPPEGEPQQLGSAEQPSCSNYPPGPHLRCNLCGSCFSMPGSLARHLRLHGQKEPKRASKGNFKSSTKKWSCPFCPRIAKLRASIIGHIICWHTEISDPNSNSVKCPFCDYQGNALQPQKGLYTHVSAHLKRSEQESSLPKKTRRKRSNNYNYTKKRKPVSKKIVMAKAKVEKKVVNPEKLNARGNVAELVNPEKLKVKTRVAKLANPKKLKAKASLAKLLNPEQLKAEGNVEELVKPDKLKVKTRVAKLVKQKKLKAKVAKLVNPKKLNAKGNVAELVNPDQLKTKTKVEEKVVNPEELNAKGNVAELVNLDQLKTKTKVEEKVVNPEKLNAKGNVAELVNPEKLKAKASVEKLVNLEKLSTTALAMMSEKLQQLSGDLPQEPQPSCSYSLDSSPAFRKLEENKDGVEQDIPAVGEKNDSETKDTNESLEKAFTTSEELPQVDPEPTSSKHRKSSQPLPETKRSRKWGLKKSPNAEICQICSMACKNRGYLVSHLIYKHSERAGPSSLYAKCPLCNYLGVFSHKNRGLLDHLFDHLNRNTEKDVQEKKKNVQKKKKTQEVEVTMQTSRPGDQADAEELPADNNTTLKEESQEEPRSQDKEENGDGELSCHECGICGKSFRKERSLKLHLTFHNNPYFFNERKRPFNEETPKSAKKPRKSPAQNPLQSGEPSTSSSPSLKPTSKLKRKRRKMTISFPSSKRPKLISKVKRKGQKVTVPSPSLGDHDSILATLRDLSLPAVEESQTARTILKAKRRRRKRPTTATAAVNPKRSEFPTTSTSIINPEPSEDTTTSTSAIDPEPSELPTTSISAVNPKMSEPSFHQNFRCECCGKCCKSNAGLKGHLRKHGNLKRGNLKKGNFKRGSDARRTHPCQLCPNAFNGRGTLIRHIISMHAVSEPNSTSVQCPFCSHQGNTKTKGLYAHVSAHLNPPPPGSPHNATERESGAEMENQPT